VLKEQLFSILDTYDIKISGFSVLFPVDCMSFLASNPSRFKLGDVLQILVTIFLFYNEVFFSLSFFEEIES
jgi:hypothetical protein